MNADVRNKAIARSKLVTYDARSPIIKTIYTWICCIIKTSFSCRNKHLWLAKVVFFSFSRSQSDLQILKTSFNNIPVDVLLVGQTVEWVHGSAVNRNTWITTENAKFKIYLLREKCLNTELFLIHKVTIKKSKLFRTNSFVLAHSSAKKSYIEQLTVKSSIQWYHMTVIWLYFWSVFSCIWTRNNSVFGHSLSADTFIVLLWF